MNQRTKTKPPQIETITSIQDIVDLAMSGFADWKKYGNVKQDTLDDLILLCYTQNAIFERTWNYFEHVCRGLIINKSTGEIVDRPFDKIFNRFEDGRKSNGRIKTITEKLDGSMATQFRHNGAYRIATKGAFNSPQAQWATEFLNNNYDLATLPKELTLIFEIIYPENRSENRLVIDYGDREDLVLLAARNRFAGNYLPFYPDVYSLAQECGFSLPKVYTFNNVTEILEICGKLDGQEEGYVVEFSDGQRFKFKGDRYLELHKLLNGLSFKNTLLAHQNGQVNYIKSQLPDEFLDEFNGWLKTIEQTIQEIKRKASEVYALAPQGSQKEFALWVNEYHHDLSVYLFATKSGYDLMPFIYKHAFKD